MERMSALPNNPAYAALLAKVPPKVIRIEKENEYFSQVLEELRFDPVRASNPVVPRGTRETFPL
jgi:hypothetical protein